MAKLSMICLEKEAAKSIEWVPVVHSVNGVLQW